MLLGSVALSDTGGTKVGPYPSKSEVIMFASFSGPMYAIKSIFIMQLCNPLPLCMR